MASEFSNRAGREQNTAAAIREIAEHLQKERFVNVGQDALSITWPNHEAITVDRLRPQLRSKKEIPSPPFHFPV